jgi:phenylpropionate dioxygenase-like ring-hydroxylating dioxygenase large terminal subunit
MGPGSEQCKNTHELAMAPTHEWNGFLFSGQIPVDVDISGRYYLHEYRKDIVQSSHVNIMDLFLDIDHIPVVHKNVYEPIGIRSFDKIRWQSWNGGSVQMVDREDGKLGALWLAVYPNTMLEWQPGAVFVMVNEVIDHRTTRSHVFQYRDADSSDSQWQLNSEIWEEAWAQDRAQAELLEPGWRITPEENLDREKRAFRAWLKDNPGT